MSGAAGGTRIKKEDLKATIRDYRDSVLKPLGLDKSYSITGVRSRPEKDIFGDIDVVVSFPGGDKKELKQTLASFIEQINKVPEIPQKKNKKYFIHGSIVSILYPIYGKENEYVQIDNIVTASKEEGKFTYKMLDLPAQEQGLALGLVKAVFTELDQNQIDKLFKDLGISDIEKPGEGEEYDFNLNPSELSLSIVPVGKGGGKTIWKSNKFSDIKTILDALGIDIEKDKFDTIINKIKKFKNRRSIDRLKGMYAKNIRVGDAEVGLEKGTKKQQSLDTVAALQEKYNALVIKMISPLLTEGENSTIAVFPGKFKPPHKDHVARINAAANVADKVLVIIGPKPADSFTAEQTLDVFKELQSKNIISSNVEFIISDLPSPVLKAYKEFEDNPNQQYIAVFGKDDISRFKDIDKLSNVKVDNFEEANIGNLSATDLRNAILNKDIPTIQNMMPNNISAEEYLDILSEVLTNTEVICDNCGWHWPIADGGDDLYICHKCGHDNTPNSNQTWNLKEGIVSLSKYMINNGLNIKPLPKIKFIDNDEENASNMLGKTAYYNPSEKSITLYTLGRHPKDILRSFSHEMIHHYQNLENRLNNINTTNTNEDGDLPELEKEAYEKGNMMLRNWEDSLKNPKPVNEIYFIDSEKYNYPKTFVDKLRESLHEITLSKDNAVETKGDLTRGEFQVGDINYIYKIYVIPNPYKDEGKFYNITFRPEENITSTPQQGKENYIKILSTMYKVILDFVEQEKPKYIGISSLDGDKNYHTVYANLTDNKFNRIPGYFRKDVSLEFDTPQGKGRFVVLKRKDV